MNNLKDNTNLEVYEILANAYATYAGCIGHSKTHYNSLIVQACEEELTRRDLEIPSTDILRAYGVYNGEGSY